MKLTFSRSAAGCLLLAGAGLVMVRLTPAGAQEYLSRGNRAAYQALNAPQSEVSRELEALYRKNGRQMPEMDLNSLQLQPEAGAHVPGSRNPVTSVNAPGGAVMLTPSKPSLLQRIFGSSKSPSRKVATPSSRKPMRRGSAVGPNYPGTHFRPGTLSSSPALQQRPAAAPQTVVQPAPVSAPAAPAAAAPPAPMYDHRLREPAFVAGVDEFQEPGRAGAARQVGRPAIRPNAAKEFLDEPLSGDDDSLELSDEELSTGAPPRVLSDRSSHGAAESPYSGKRLAAPDALIEDQAVGDSPAARAGLKRPGGGRTGIAPEETPHEGLPPLDEGSDLMIDNDANDEAPLAMPEEESPARPTLKVIRPEEREISQAKLRTTTEAAGLKGFCPVALKDERKLLEAQKDLHCEHDGKLYHFASPEAKALFQKNPSRYVPAAKGADVVKQAAGEEGVEGTLDRAVWYRGRLYLFASDESLEEFIEEPARYATSQ